MASTKPTTAVSTAKPTQAANPDASSSDSSSSGQVVVYDYSACTPEDRAALTCHVQSIRSAETRVNNDILLIGECLTDAQERLSRESGGKQIAGGGFIAWVKAEFGWGIDSAYRYISIFKEFGTSYATWRNSQGLTTLPNMPFRALAVLAQLADEETKAKFVAKADAGEKVTVKEVQDALDQVRRADEKTQAAIDRAKAAEEAALSADDARKDAEREANALKEDNHKMLKLKEQWQQGVEESRKHQRTINDMVQRGTELDKEVYDLKKKIAHMNANPSFKDKPTLPAEYKSMQDLKKDLTALETKRSGEEQALQKLKADRESLEKRLGELEINFKVEQSKAARAADLTKAWERFCGQLLEVAASAANADKKQKAHLLELASAMIEKGTLLKSVAA